MIRKSEKTPGQDIEKIRSRWVEHRKRKILGRILLS